MDHTLLLLSITTVVIAVITIVLLVVVLRHLGRHRRELAALTAAAEGHEVHARASETSGGAEDGSAGPSADDSLHRVAVVLNPSKFEETDTFHRKITDVVERIEGAEVVFYETTIEDPGTGQTEQAVADGADLVVAAGGDGTVRLVASVLAGTDTRMGIIPAGTGNLLARNVEVPLDDPTAAMIAALTGTDRQVDVGWLRIGDSIAAARSAERQIFLVIAGFGADAEMIGYTDPEMKKRIGWIAYIFGGIRTVLGRSVDVVVQLPDETRHAHKARTVLLGNVGKLPGGFVLMPDATIDNGLLEVVVAGWRGAAGFSQVAAQVVNPKLTPKFGPKLASMDRYLTTGIQVTTTKPQPVQLDGDTDAEATHMIATVDPGVLRLRVPEAKGAKGAKKA
ncbi:sphingosine kinase [Brachybacterium vulturis]|uniref:Sphingosine kinase n=1 Tax=Brachybacterium vulturis TaxID=2017484 RepID=A0A291GRI6_9MICO|nr:diacylglycerol kinase family protein [Brachybacterium vulturis]ATG52861.1 sphingosine kinase [Brachybacterium vulturis]